MSSNFIINAKPKSSNAKSHKTLEHCNSLKPPKKPRQKRKGRSDTKPVTVIKLNPSPQFEPSSVMMKFMFINWSNDEEEKNYTQESMSINDFKTIDSKENFHCLVIDENIELDNKTIFAKVSRKIAQRGMASPVNTKFLQKYVIELMQHKPQVDRGKKCDSVNTGYRIMGSHADRTSSGNREYAFRPGVPDDKQEELRQKTAHIVEHLQTSLISINPLLHCHYSLMVQVAQTTTLDVYDKHAPAFLVGKHYHSRCHIDNNMYLTTATVIAPDKKHNNKIIYYFTFLTYALKIPLQSGDTLLFNPLIPHSCSNPKYKESYIMSAYVSNKTVLREKKIEQSN